MSEAPQPGDAGRGKAWRGRVLTDSVTQLQNQHTYVNKTLVAAASGDACSAGEARQTFLLTLCGWRGENSAAWGHLSSVATAAALVCLPWRRRRFRWPSCGAEAESITASATHLRTSGFDSVRVVSSRHFARKCRRSVTLTLLSFTTSTLCSIMFGDVRRRYLLLLSVYYLILILHSLLLILPILFRFNL